LNVTETGAPEFKIRVHVLVVDLDDSGHLVAGVVPAAAAGAEEQDPGDQCKQNAGDADEECPVEHHLVFVEANLIVLVHETTVDANANTNADSCNMATEQTHYPAVLRILRYLL